MEEEKREVKLYSEDDKFFSRIMAKDLTRGGSSRIYYYTVVPVSVPFRWEDEPGKPKGAPDSPNLYIDYGNGGDPLIEKLSPPPGVGSGTVEAWPRPRPRPGPRLRKRWPVSIHDVRSLVSFVRAECGELYHFVFSTKLNNDRLLCNVCDEDVYNALKTRCVPCFRFKKTCCSLVRLTFRS